MGPRGRRRASILTLASLLASALGLSSSALASGATIELNRTLVKTLHRDGVALYAAAPAAIEGSTLTLPTSGSLSTSGQGVLECAGGIGIRRGKRIARLRHLVLDTAHGSLDANLGYGELTLATTAGLTSTREGFGVRALTGLHLTPAAARALRGRLHLPGRAHRLPTGPRGHGRLRGKRRPGLKPAFEAGQFLGTAVSSTQASALAIEPGSEAALTLDRATLAKLASVKVGVSTLAPASEPSASDVQLPIGGGSFDPNALATTLETGGELRLTQVLGQSRSELAMGSPRLEFDPRSGHLTAELSGHSNTSIRLGFGSVGRASIADLEPAGSLQVDPSARTIGLKQAAVVWSPLGAELLDAFRQTYEQATGGKAEPDQIRAGDPVGTLSLSALAE